MAALGMLTEWGLKPAQLKLISVLGSRQGVDHVHEEFPEVEVGAGKGSLMSAVWSQASVRGMSTQVRARRRITLTFEFGRSSSGEWTTS